MPRASLQSVLLICASAQPASAVRSVKAPRPASGRLSAPRRAQLLRPHSPWANATTAVTRRCVRSKIERQAGSAAAYTQRRLSYCAFFRNDPAPRAIALSISMPEAFTDFNSARRMRPHCERSVCISSLGVVHGRPCGDQERPPDRARGRVPDQGGQGQVDSSWGERACTHKKAPFTGSFCFARLSEPQTARGNSKLFAYVMSQCSNRIGTKVAEAP